MAQAQPLGPEDLPNVFNCLKWALSPQQEQRQQAEAALRGLETRPGFVSCLAEILASSDADHSARWLAAVPFKNCCNKYWRARLPGSLGEEEKAHLRQKLLSLVAQDDSQIAVQVAVVFAKVARFDYPRAWPSLFADLLGVLQGGSTLAQRRVYLALHHILKELASKRLAADQRNFEQITAQLLEPVWRQWAADTRAVSAALPAALHAPPPQAQALLLTFERWLLELKGLRRMVLFGFPSDARTLQQVPAVAEVAPALLQVLQAFAAARAGKTGGPRNQVQAMLDRGLLKLVKTLRQMQEMHPWSFLHSGILVPCLELCCGHLLHVDPHSTHVGQQYTMQCLLFVHGVQKSPPYKGSAAALTLNLEARDNVDQLKGMAAEAQRTLAGFWCGGRLQALVAALIERLFPLMEKELEAWEDSPEAFHHELENTAWEESVRGCAENAYLALFEGHRDQVASVVLDLLRRTNEACAALTAGGSAGAPPAAHLVRGVPAAILAKEAVYHAAAVGAYELHDYIDFSAWLRGSLLVEMSDAAPAARPLRRRALKLPAHWLPKLAKADRPAVYAAEMGALVSGDAALQLAAVASLQALIDDWDFEEAQFLEFVGPCFQLTAALLQSAAEFDTQLQAFSLLNLVIDRLAESMKPYTSGLMQLLPAVWHEAEGQSLLRIQVLLALQRLVNALGAESPACYPLVLPVLRLCTDINQPDEINLLEDGLQLWLVALRNAPAPHPELLAIFPHLVAAMERSTEHMATGMNITASCVLLGGADFLPQHGAGLVQILCGFIGNVKERGMLALMPTMHLVIQSFPGEGPHLLGPALQRLLADVLSGREPGLVVAAALGVFARVLLQNGPAFLALFQAAAPYVQPPADAAGAGGTVAGGAGGADPAQRLLLALVDLWLDRFDCIGQLGARKLSALALCVAATLPLPALLERLEIIVTHVTSVWFEVEGSELAGSVHLRAEDIVSQARDEDGLAAVNSEEAEGESSRRLALHEADPVVILCLSAFARQQLEAAAAAHGVALSAALNAISPSLAGQLQAMLASA